MQLKTILNRVQKFKSSMYAEVRPVGTATDLAVEVFVVPRANGRAVCSRLMNWFRAKGQLSSGVVEGFNTNAKLTTRKPDGFRAYHGAEIALYPAVGALPEPERAHIFC